MIISARPPTIGIAFRRPHQRHILGFGGADQFAVKRR
jgi:hypothetical protein